MQYQIYTKVLGTICEIPEDSSTHKQVDSVPHYFLVHNFKCISQMNKLVQCSSEWSLKAQSILGEVMPFREIDPRVDWCCKETI